MKIAATQYSLAYKAFEIYLSGCDGACSKSCHNKELWNFNIGENYLNIINSIIKKINEFGLLIDNIWILGGEPLLQNKRELVDLLERLKLGTNKKIWLWTRFELEQIPDNIKMLCDYIKTGKYDENLLSDNYIHNGIKLISTNQKINIKGADYEIKS